MAPLPLLRVARDLLKDIKGVGEKAGDTAGDAVDTAKDSKEVIGQAKDALATYDKLKDQATAYYQWYLDHKPLIYFILACIAAVIVLCLLQCVFQYLKMITQSCCFCFKCGIFCVKHRKACGPYCKPLCRGCGSLCIRTKGCVIDQKEVDKADEKRNDIGGGCDTTFLIRCGGINPVERGLDGAQRQKLGVWLNEKIPCLYLPGDCGKVLTPAEQLEKLKRRKKNFEAAWERLDNGPAKEILRKTANELGHLIEKTSQAAVEKANEANRVRSGSRHRPAES